MAVSKIQQVTNNSGSNYCKMPDGTLMQWGIGTVPANEQSTEIIFPQSFYYSSYGFCAIGVYNNSGEVDFVFYNETVDKLTLHRNGDKSFAQTFRRIAIGRWK